MIVSNRFRNITIGTFLALFIFCSCGKNDSIVIKGIITSSKDTKIVLDKLSFSKSTVLDSVRISKGEDEFRFKVKSITEPTFFIVRVVDKGSITLLAEPGEDIQLVIKDQNLSDYTVIGSKGSILTQKLFNKLNSTNKLLDSLRIKYKLTEEPDLKAKIDQEYTAAVDSQHAFSSKFIWANPMSRASVMALYQKYSDNTYVFENSADLLLFKTVASSIKALYPESDYTKGMISDIKRMESIITNNNISNLLKQAKSSIPEIALPNVNGDTLKLSNLKGKVVLLDFWTSSDQTSTMDNRELIEIYNKFKGKGFEIYQVSLDTNRDEWVNAIESARIPWMSVSELSKKGSYYARLYNIQQLPSNYLIDRNQVIIGKNLYGESLKSKLREVL